MSDEAAGVIRPSGDRLQTVLMWSVLPVLGMGLVAAFLGYGHQLGWLFPLGFGLWAWWFRRDQEHWTEWDTEELASLVHPDTVARDTGPDVVSDTPPSR